MNSQELGVSQEQYSQELQKKAFDLFIEVSRQCPASSMAQGAKIADHCLQTGDKPIPLRDAILFTPKLVDEILALAKQTHSKSSSSGIYEIGTEDVRRVVYQDFWIANELLNLEFPRDKLKQIYNVIYKKYAKHPQKLRLVDTEGHRLIDRRRRILSRRNENSVKTTML